MEKQFVSPVEAVKIVGLSRTTIWRLESEGGFPPKVRLSPGRVGYRMADIQAWIDARMEIL